MRTEKGAHPQGTAMASENTRQAKLITIASFPINYFVENMAVRADSSILVTVANRNQLWYIPPRNANVPVEPVPLFTFSQSAMGIVEVEPDIFIYCHFAGHRIPGSDLVRSFVHVARVLPQPLGLARLDPWRVREAGGRPSVSRTCSRPQRKLPDRSEYYSCRRLLR